MEKHIIESTLSDGSSTFDLLIVDKKSDCHIQLRCVDEKAAASLYDALDLTTVDF